jgi:hypothetical protein
MNSLVDIPGAPPHLIEAGRLHPPLLDGATDHRVESDVGELGTVVEPSLASVLFLDYPWSSIGEPLGHPVLEDVRWFDDVVISGDDRVLPFRFRGVG